MNLTFKHIVNLSHQAISEVFIRKIFLSIQFSVSFNKSEINVLVNKAKI